MGKNLIQQRRGKGSIFKAPKHRAKGIVRLAPVKSAETGVVRDIITTVYHSAPLLVVHFGTEKRLMLAPEGVCVGDTVSSSATEIRSGNTFKLKDLPEGTLVHNIEAVFGDGGKFIRSSGVFGRIAQKTAKGISVVMPSGGNKIFKEECRATVGVLAAGGRLDKPFMKAGNKFKAMKAKGHKYPKVCGISMNAVAHPFGSKCSHIKGRPTQSSRHAPPGRKVGKIAPSRTGYKR